MKTGREDEPMPGCKMTKNEKFKLGKMRFLVTELKKLSFTSSCANNLTQNASTCLDGRFCVFAAAPPETNMETRADCFLVIHFMGVLKRLSA
ncbi:hypothetical protein CDAR_590331 [Caerostris darwini]|uniref:Uncharacterized protein n=1 Tax=Caerostris darwini TaxID=1538125 RepID=A0AAV4NRY2_9ARAC|nr:hypothetical protein CDAR_590331 [Caerostris darwini]